ncbi:MAG: glycosyltransferase family 2 protein [Acidimicrobiales bacterium]
MRTEPVVAVVIPTYNRAHLLPRLLTALRAQVDTPPFEVVVVDDCSTDDTAHVLATAASHPPASPLVSVRRTSRNAGPAAARNIGWRASRAPLVAFTDDDCVPHPGWVATMAAALQDADVVQGRTTADQSGFVRRGPFPRMQIYEHWSDYFAGCNVGYRRRVLERLDGFDETFRRPFGEDVDLGWRAVESGATTGWADNAVVVHDVETTGDIVRDWFRWVRDTSRTQWAALTVKRHPVFRRTMYRRWFFRSTHPPTLLAIAGVGGLLTPGRTRRRWLWAAALGVPYVMNRLAADRLPVGLKARIVMLPPTFVGDVAEVAAVLRGAIRFRTVLV